MFTFIWTRSKKILSQEELQLRKEKNKQLRDVYKAYQNIRKYSELFEKVFALISMCENKKVLNCIENIQLFNKFVEDLKYM